MAYVDPNFKTKKALKEAIAKGEKVTVYSVGIYPAARDGWESIEGPHYPQPHRWYCSVFVQDGIVLQVKD
jgi:hypothetical protein